MWALDSGRLFASVVVLIGHASMVFGWSIWGSIAPSALAWFFIVSGFVLGTVYSGMKINAPELRDFYVRRFCRIYPMYLFGVALGACTLLLLAPGMTLASIAAAGYPEFLTFDLPQDMGYQRFWIIVGETLVFSSVFDASHSARYFINGPFWSICTEVVFYLFFPLMLIAMRQVRSVAALWALVAALWLAQFALVVLYMGGWDGPGAGWPNVSSSVYTNPITRAPEFLTGIALARIHLLRPFKLSAPQQVVGWGLMSVLLVFMLELGSRDSMWPLGMFWLTVPANVVLVVLMVMLPKPSPRFEAWSSKAGFLSFAMYALHWPSLLFAWVAHTRFGVPVWACIAVVFVVCMLGGLFLVSHYETPARRWLNALFKSRSARVPVSSAVSR